MKKVLVIGASGLIGRQIVSQLTANAEVIKASLNDPTHPVDIANPSSLKALFAKVGKVDAIICTAGMVNFVPWHQATDADWQFGIENKMMGQINTLRFGSEYVNDGGAIMLTTGVLAQHPFPGSAIVSAVNAGVELAIKAAALEQDRIRFNAVSPGWVTETLEAMAMDPEPGMPATEIAKVYLDLLAQSTSGDIKVAAK